MYDLNETTASLYEDTLTQMNGETQEQKFRRRLRERGGPPTAAYTNPLLESDLPDPEGFGENAMRAARIIFSPIESLQTAMFAATDDEDISSTQVFARRMSRIWNNQETRDYVGEFIDKSMPGSGGLAKGAAGFGLEVLTDPTNLAIGGGAGYAAFKGIKRLLKGRSTKLLGGAIDDLVDLTDISKAESKRLYKLTEDVELGKKGAYEKFDAAMSKHIPEWELKSAEKDASFFTTVGGSMDETVSLAEKQIPTVVRVAQAELNTKRFTGDLGLLAKELDLPVGHSHNFHAAYLDINTPDDIVDLAKTYTVETQHYVDEAFKKADPQQKIILGVNLKKQKNLLSAQTGEKVNLDISDVQAFATRRMITDLAENIRANANALRAMKYSSSADQLRFYKLIGVYGEVTDQLAKTTGRGKLMQTLSTPGGDHITAKTIQAQRAINKIPGYLTSKQERQLIDAFADLSDGDQAQVLINQIKAGGMKDLGKNIHTYWVNSILSGPYTHIRNIDVNIANQMLKPVEFAMVGDFKAAQQSAIGLAEGVKNMWRVISKSPSEPAKNYDMFKKMHELNQHAGTSVVASTFDAMPWYQKGQNYISRAINLPTKFMGGTDAVFKSVGYHQALREQVRSFVVRQTDDIATQKLLTERYMRKPLATMEKRAFEEAERMTFQQPHEGGAWMDVSRGIEKTLQSVPWNLGKWAVPFYKTPINIIRKGIEYTPYSFMFKQTWKDIKGGGTKARLALAKGAVMPATLTSMATMMDEKVTGRLGENPYTLYIGGQAINYRLIEPLRWTIGAAADVRDVIQGIDWEASDAQEIWQTMIMGVMGAYARPVNDALFIRNVAPIVNAVSNWIDRGNPTGLARIAQNYVTGMVPYSGMLSQGNQMLFDADRREFVTLTEKLKSRIPGLSETLPFQVGLLGEPLTKNFIFESQKPTSKHPVYQEMRKLDMKIPDVTRVVKGVKLNMVERATLRRYRAEPVSGTTLRSNLRELFDSYIYRSASHEQQQALITNMISRFNTLGTQRLLSENSRLQG